MLECNDSMSICATLYADIDSVSTNKSMFVFIIATHSYC